MGQKSIHFLYNIKDSDNIGWKIPPRYVPINGVDCVKYDETLPNINTPVYFSDNFKYYLTFNKDY